MLSKQKPKMQAEEEIERVAIQMRISEILSMMTRSGADKGALEAEYQQLISQLK